MTKRDHDRFFGPSMWPKLFKCPAFRSDESQNSSAAQKGTELHQYLQDTIEDIPSMVNLSLASKKEINGIHWAATVIQESLDGIVCEQEVVVYGPNGEERTHGTADIIGRDKTGCLVVMDLKTGFKRDYMLQIMAYAIGVMQREKEDHCKGLLVYSVSMQIDSYDFYLDQSIKEMENLYLARCAPEPQRFNNDYCCWCAQRHDCPRSTPESSQ